MLFCMTVLDILKLNHDDRHVYILLLLVLFMFIKRETVLIRINLLKVMFFANHFIIRPKQKLLNEKYLYINS